MPNPLVPSQEAREAAADAWRAHSSEQQALEIAAGEHDDWPIVQAFERVIRAARRDEVEKCIAAVHSERLTDPDFTTSDEAYQRALDDAEAALRARHAGESPDGR